MQEQGVDARNDPNVPENAPSPMKHRITGSPEPDDEKLDRY